MNAMDQLSALFTRMNLRHDRVDQDRIHLGFEGMNVWFDVGVVDGGSMITVFAFPRVKGVERPRIPVLLELINQLNATRLRFGAFFLRPDTGQITFEWAIPMPDTLRLQTAQLLMAAAGTVDLYFPAFAHLLWGGQSVEGAVAAAAATFEQYEQADDSASDGGASDDDTGGPAFKLVV